MDTELKHYGIKGMKWGVRRTPEQLGHVRSLRDTHKTTTDPSKMSDAELRKRAERLELEERYAVAKDKQKARSTSVVKKLLTDAANQLATKTLNALVAKFVNKMFDKKNGGNKKNSKKHTGKDYAKMDLMKMDDEMIANAVSWYENAFAVEELRSVVPRDLKKRRKKPKRGN